MVIVVGAFGHIIVDDMRDVRMSIPRAAMSVATSILTVLPEAFDGI
jgi:hypothetical protein